MQIILHLSDAAVNATCENIMRHMEIIWLEKINYNLANI